MRAIVAPLLPLQPIFVPALLILFVWAAWRTAFRKDLAVGLGLYLGLVIVVDGFMNTGIYLPGIDKGSIRYSEVCAIFLLFNRLPAGETQPPRRLVYGLLSVYFGLLALAALRADSLLSSLMEFRNMIVPQIVACVVASRGLNSAQAYRRFLMSLSVTVIFVGMFDFWDVFFDRWILKSAVLDKPMYSHNRELNRFGSLFLNPNYLGAFVVLVFPPTFVWALSETRFWARLYGGASLMLMLFLLVQTQSRAPLLAFGIGLVLLVVGPCSGVSRKRRVGLLGTVAAAVLLIMPGFYEHAVGRFSKLDQETSGELALSRQTTWTYTLRIIEDHLIGGIGYGEPQFIKAMSSYGFEEEFGVGSLDAPHNSYLQIAVYAGIPALLAFLLANLLLLAKATALARRSANDSDTGMVFGLAVGVTGFLVSIFPDLQLFTASVAPVYWVFFGLLLSLTTMRQKGEESAALTARAADGSGLQATWDSAAARGVRVRVAPRRPQVVRPVARSQSGASPLTSSWTRTHPER
jgi:O-antigen ligase